jgi:hypothetical protein
MNDQASGLTIFFVLPDSQISKQLLYGEYSQCEMVTRRPGGWEQRFILKTLQIEPKSMEQTDIEAICSSMPYRKQLFIMSSVT